MLGYDSGFMAARTALLAVAALLVGQGGVALAQDAEKCFDKATLTYFDCPKPAEAMAPMMEEPWRSQWTGPYLGIHGGYAWADMSGTQNGVSLDVLSPEGFLVGAQLGYLHEYENHLALGLEVDVSKVFADDTASALGQRSRVDAELNWLASARLRAGYVMGEVMPFVTGGVALANYGFDSQVPAVSLDETAFGGVFGGGIDFMLDPNVVLRAEGLYYIFDDSQTITNGNVGLDNVGVARAALSYKF